MTDVLGAVLHKEPDWRTLPPGVPSAVQRALRRCLEKDLRARLKRKAALWPGKFDLRPLNRIYSIRGFDDAYTAPQGGFGNADNYYTQASAVRLIDRVTIPTLIVTAEDDPFVPGDQFRRPVVTGNPHVRVEITPHGGHCGFVSTTGYWAEDRKSTRLNSSHT